MSICLFLAFNVLSHPIFLEEKWETGFIPIEAENSLFYWLFKSRMNNTNAPLILWLQGGPGCSGIMSVFLESGPYRINDDLTLYSNPFSWNTNSDVLYVDQPLGTPFSTCKDPTRIPKNGTQTAKDLYAFLDGFVQKHKEYNGRSFYIAGSSYGGHFVPQFAKYLVDQKAKFIKLEGIAIGNGWYKPTTQFDSYANFDWNHGLIKNYISYFGSKISYYLTSTLIDLNWSRAAFLFNMMSDGIGNGIQPRFNIYDIRKKCDFPGTCYNATSLLNFMKRKDVLEALKVGDRVWSVCSAEVFDSLLDNDYFTDMSSVLKDLLDKHSNIKVTLFNGNQDWICNIEGMNMFLKEFEWHGQNILNETPYTPWFVTGHLAGKYKKVGNFTFYEVNDAGHLVSYDQPEFSYDIITELIKPY